MAYDPGLVARLRDALARLGERGSRERGVFGGWGFLQGKSTFVIAYDDVIIAKMPPGAYESALARPGVSAFAPDGARPMTTWVVVSADVIADDPDLAEWVALALQGVRSAPPTRTSAKAKPVATGASQGKTKGPSKATRTTQGKSEAKNRTSSARGARNPGRGAR